jgi:hypothetical protein
MQKDTDIQDNFIFGNLDICTKDQAFLKALMKQLYFNMDKELRYAPKFDLELNLRIAFESVSIVEKIQQKLRSEDKKIMALYIIQRTLNLLDRKTNYISEGLSYFIEVICDAMNGKLIINKDCVKKGCFSRLCCGLKN